MKFILQNYFSFLFYSLLYFYFESDENQGEENPEENENQGDLKRRVEIPVQSNPVQFSSRGSLRVIGVGGRGRETWRGKYFLPFHPSLVRFQSSAPQLLIL